MLDAVRVVLLVRDAVLEGDAVRVEELVRERDRVEVGLLVGVLDGEAVRDAEVEGEREGERVEDSERI